MPHPLSREDLRILLREADAGARRMQRRYHLSREDGEDVRQDLLADFLSRIEGFDTTRGSLGAFAGRVMANRSTRLAKHFIRHRKIFGAVPVCPDSLNPNAGDASRPGHVGEILGPTAYQERWTDPMAQVERSVDLARCLCLLDEAGQRLASGLAGETAHQLAKRGENSRSDLYRQARRIRLALVALGLEAA
jgi:DNA-directed RNA polymerase specialized sigma24 family protein